MLAAILLFEESVYKTDLSLLMERAQFPFD